MSLFTTTLPAVARIVSAPIATRSFSSFALKSNLLSSATSSSTIFSTRTHSSPSSLVASSSLLPTSSLFHQPIRSIHNPRRLRGVGPRPRRRETFLRKGWLRWRTVLLRARAWKLTHSTPILAQPVQMVGNSDVKLSLPVIKLSQGRLTDETLALDARVFAHPLRGDVIGEVIRWQRTMRRQGTHKTKGRAEVFGSGKKLRPQKGSGRARMRDGYAPTRVGGGRTFPKRPSNYGYDLPLARIRTAKKSVLSCKLKEGNLFVVDRPLLATADSERFLLAMKRLQWGEYLLVHARDELDPNLVWASKGLPSFDYLCEDKLNVLDLLKAHRVVLTKAAVQAITMRLTIGTEKNNADNTRFLVGTYGGGYNADQVQFARANETVPGTVVDGVEVDGAKLVIKEGAAPAQPIHWP